MNWLTQQLPPSEKVLRQRIYAGTCFLLPPNPASLALVTATHTKLEAAFPGKNLRQLAQIHSNDFLLHDLRKVRQALREDPEIQQIQRQLIASLGFATQAFAYDFLRLRAIFPGAHHLPAAAPAYYAHRDTWYANPEAQINLWLPLFPYPETMTFTFCPEVFQSPVPNDSQTFDYRVWKTKVGWQSSQAPDTASYPRALELPDSLVWKGFASQPGEVLAFSAQHLHQPCQNTSQEIRFSIDFRLVHRRDLATGLGPRNVDNRSQGQAWDDYLTEF